MKIIVGSTNPAKIEAVKEVLALYPPLAQAEIERIEAQSEVSDQPKTIEETIRGARNRAYSAYQLKRCNYSIGLESGIHNFPYVGWMDFTACAIYDGNKFYEGLSPAFKLPEKVAKAAINNGLNLNQACYQLGLSTSQEIGKAEGIIGILTKGRKTRKDYTKDAIIMAMIHVENEF